MHCTLELHFAVVKRPFELFGLGNLARSLQEVLFNAVVALRANREHACLRTHVAHVSAVEPICQLHDGLPIDLALLSDFRGVDPKNVQSRRLIGEWNLDLSVQSTLRTVEETRINDCRLVGERERAEVALALHPI